MALPVETMVRTINSGERVLISLWVSVGGVPHPFSFRKASFSNSNKCGHTVVLLVLILPSPGIHFSPDIDFSRTFFQLEPFPDNLELEPGKRSVSSGHYT